MDIEQKKSASSEEIVSYIREQLESMRDAALQQIEAAEERAAEQENRYHQAREELHEAQTRLHSLREEAERLPFESHKQRMRGAEKAEQELNDRYRTVEQQIEQDEQAVQSLSAELDYLCPGSRRISPDHGVPLEARTPLNAEAQRQSEELDSLQDEITDASEELLGPVFDKAQGIQQQVAALSSAIEGRFKQEGYRSAAEIEGHGEVSAEAEYGEGDYVLISDSYAANGVHYQKGDLVRLEGAEADRLIGSGSAVRPDSEVGQLLLAGDVEAAMKLHLQSRSRGHTIHQPQYPLSATPQSNPQREQESVRPEDDPETLDKIYANGGQGPDWAAIRGRQNQKLSPRGPRPDDSAE